MDSATRLANQMLTLAKVEHLRQQASTELTELTELTDWAATLREVALDLAPLIAEADLDFELATLPAPVRADA